MKLTQKHLEKFRQFLRSEEKSNLTVEKYVHDVSAFAKWLHSREISKEAAVEYKQYLAESLAPASVNSKLSALNSFFDFVNLKNCRVKAIKIQRRLFSGTNKELSKAEYNRLLAAAKDNKRLYYLMQTICSTGIRVSEDI